MSQSQTFYTHAYVKGNDVLLRGIRDGKKFKKAVPYKPTLFVPGPEIIKNLDSPNVSSWRSIKGQVLRPTIMDSIYDAKDYIEQYKQVDNFRVFGFPRWAYAYLNEAYPGEVHYDADLLRILFLDIEVDSEDGFPNVLKADNEITAITAKDKMGYTVFGCGEFTIPEKDIRYIHCRNEIDLLTRFINFWIEGNGQGYPDIVSGWNIGNFDIPYLYRRILDKLGEVAAKKLSPWALISEREGFDKFGKKTTTIDLHGVETLDYLDLYRKFTYAQQASYRLDHITHIELNERKMAYDDYATLAVLYKENYQKFIEYNIHDVRLVEMLDKKMKLIDLALTIAYDAKVNYTDVFMQVRLWDVLIHNYLWNQKVAVPVEGGGHKTETYVGAYVKEPQLGRHHWVINFDVNSMYPNLIRMFNISPEMILDQCHADLTVDDILKGDIPAIAPHTCLGANGWIFKTDKKGFLPEMMERFSAQRILYKDKMQDAQKLLETTTNNSIKEQAKLDISKYKNLQLAKKLQLNACYGALGNPHFRFFDIRQATAVTLGGQLIIRYAEQEINKELNAVLNTSNIDYVIASDTDSLYLRMDGVIKNLQEAVPNLTKNQIVNCLDKFSNTKLLPAFINMFAKLSGIMHGSNTILMKREAIADQGIWTAKKRYILNVYDNEGIRYGEPKLKVMGIESVKSSTPASCRKALTKTMELLVRNTEIELQSYIDEYWQEFQTLPFEDIAFPRSVQNLGKYRDAEKGIPIHVCGALLYNNKLKDFKLNKKYEKIKEGEKIKFCYLKEPNPLHSHVIAAITVLPKEFKLNEYLDYTTQFEKAFLEPVRAILKVVGWHEKPVASLEGFFS